MTGRHLLLSLLFTVLLTGLIVPPVETRAGFGDDYSFESFAGDEFGEAFREFPLHQTYFIHDTLLKILFLLFFAGAGIIILQKKRSFRRLLLLLSLIILGFYLGGFLCPFASVQNAILNYQTAFLLLFLIPTILSLILGRVFCGYICAFGAVQELLHLPRYRVTISGRFLKLLQKIKYMLLIYLVFRAVGTNSVVLAGYTPFNALFSFDGRPVAFALTVLTAILSIFVYRPFCRFFCPLGAWLGLCATLSRYNILPHSCTQCNKCSAACPCGAVSGGQIDKKECLVCGRCADSCRLIADKKIRTAVKPAAGGLNSH